jgi:ribonuclease P protein component
MGFSRAVRLRKSPDFDRVQRSGRRTSGQNLVILAYRNGTSSPRFGLAVSRKVGNAVVRNRVKRRLRESIRRQRAGIGGFDVVVIARPTAATAGYHVLYAEVGDALDRLRQERA